MLNNVCVITIRTNNLNESIEFYTKVLGFEVEKHYGKTITSLKHATIPIVLEEHQNLQLNNDNQVVLAIQSQDIEADMEQISSKGIKFQFEQPQPCPPGKYNIIQDPTGNSIELVELAS